MFDNLGWGELMVLAILGLLVIGPERLPKVAADAGRMVRELRRTLAGLRADLHQDLGPELDQLRALDPRRILHDPAGSPAGPAVLPRGERPPYDPDTT